VFFSHHSAHYLNQQGCQHLMLVVQFVESVAPQQTISLNKIVNCIEHGDAIVQPSNATSHLTGVGDLFARM